MTTLTPRTTTVVLFQGDDYDAVTAALNAFQNKATLFNAKAAEGAARIGDSDAAFEAQEAYNALAEEAAERAFPVKLMALPRKAWRGLVGEHPPRSGDEGDDQVGFNRDTMGDDLVPACVQDGQFPSIADRDQFLDTLSDGDFEKLYVAAIELNTGLGPDPKARLSWMRSPRSDVTSSSHENER